MAGTLVAGRIAVDSATRVRFEAATRADDADLRRLLRENATPGRIALAFEREPSFFADACLWESKQTVIAREAGRLVCAGSCAVRRSFVNGYVCRVGYLGGLRLDRRASGRSDILRRGYGAFREIMRDHPPDFLFTSIARDNHAARRFLERGLAGMPRYEHVGDFVTLVLRTPTSATAARRRLGERKLNPAASGSRWDEELAGRLNAHNQACQFAPCWTGEELTGLGSLGLHAEDFQVTRERGNITACAALWDQRGFAQTVIAGYTPWLARLKPLINLAARLARSPLLPVPGTPLARATISHIAVETQDPDSRRQLIGSLLRIASDRSIHLITMGFAAGDPQAAEVRAWFPCREYWSRLYLVGWPGTSGRAALDGRRVQPELALL